MADKTIISKQECGRILCRSERQINRLMLMGSLVKQPEKFGRRIMFDLVDVLALRHRFRKEGRLGGDGHA